MAAETPDGPSPYALFDQFMVSNTQKEIVHLFDKLKKTLQLDPSLKHLQLYGALKEKLTSWKCRSIWSELDKRASQKPYEGGTAAGKLSAIVVGAGPCGLRMAIECVLLGCEVVVLEKRETFSRNNVLHLWPFTIEDLKRLGAKKFYGKFCAGTLDHLSIRVLQCLLLKVCLLLGVTFCCPVEFQELVEPSEGRGWRIKVAPDGHFLQDRDIDVLIGADGRKSTTPGFVRKEFRGKLALAITANFVNYFTQEEASVEEIAGVARIFNQKFFKELKDELSIDLENIVYYKDETHYFVMTAKKESLRLKGVLREDFSDARQLLQPSNIDMDRLYQYAYEAAEWSTELPRLDFASGKIPNVPDVALFDFTSMHAAEHSCRVVPKDGHELLLLLVGDSLLEPFWPMGTGLARGFLSVFDAAWMMKGFAAGRDRLELIAERECAFRFLAQTTTDSLMPKMADYSIQPDTRYNKVKLRPNPSSQFKFLYTSNLSRKRSVKVKRTSAHGPQGNEETSLQKKFKEIRSKVEEPCPEDPSSEPGPEAAEDEEVSIPTEAPSRVVATPEELLKWFSSEVKEYGLKVKDFQTSFRNGMVLCALMHRYFPQDVDFPAHKPFSMLKNNGKAMLVAEKQLGIARIMKPAEMMSADRLALLAYLSQFYELLQDREPLGKPPSPTAVPSGSGLLSTTRADNRCPSPVIGRLSTPSPPCPSPGHTPDLVRREPKPNKVPASQRFSVASSDICFFCNKKVYLMERQSAEGAFFHRPCFRCSHCSCQLQVGNYAYSRGQGGAAGKFFCRPHFRQLFMSNPEAINYARVGAGSKQATPPPKAVGSDQPAEGNRGDRQKGAEKPATASFQPTVDDDDVILPEGEGKPRESTPVRPPGLVTVPEQLAMSMSMDDSRRQTLPGLDESFEIKIANRPAKVVDISQRSVDYGMDSFGPEVLEAGLEGAGPRETTPTSPIGVPGFEPGNEEFGSPPPALLPTATTSPARSIPTRYNTSMSSNPNQSLASTYGTPLGDTLRSRTRGQRHLYRSVKMTAQQRGLSEVEGIEKKKQMNRFREAQDIQHQLGVLEAQHDDLATVGGKVERALRQASVVNESQLMLQWLDIVHQRNVLIRTTNDLANRMRDLEVEDQLHEVEHQLQELATKEMTEAVMAVYERLLREKLSIIDLRDNFVDLADTEKRREEEEDLDQSKMLESVFGVADQHGSGSGSGEEEGGGRERSRSRSATVIPVAEEQQMEKARKTKKQRWSLLGFGKKK